MRRAWSLSRRLPYVRVRILHDALVQTDTNGGTIRGMLKGAGTISQAQIGKHSRGDTVR